MRTAARIAIGLALVLLIGLAAAAVFVAANQFVPPQDRRPAAFVKAPAAADDLSWTSYGGDPGQTRHSAITQITPANVGHLRLAWSYNTGEIARRGRWARAGKFQSTPILAGGNLVFCTPFNRVIALDPATGAERWVHEPSVQYPDRVPGEMFNCRGLAQWRDGAAPDAPCSERLFMATTDRRLIALDAREGSLCMGFGEGGEVRVPIGGAELGAAIHLRPFRHRRCGGGGLGERRQ